jgi:alkanesulfonate monooxygenase SsuD/methylene tetrahydromethanopterin reductase-like flavin-dependent oxidoreductase (luciferase family)
MTARRRGVALTPMETRLDVIVQTAVLADELGYEVFALPEGWGLDSATVLTKIALGTRRIQVASSVLSVWGRTPATLAMTAATLQQISGGRPSVGHHRSDPPGCGSHTGRRFRGEPYQAVTSVRSTSLSGS